jgi:hypothetical protein
MLRPDAIVLGEEALVPDANVVRPAPTRLTHELVVDEPYRFDESDRAGDPDGILAAGTPVLLLAEGPEFCRVADGSGLAVDVRRTSLRELPAA